MKVQIYGSGCEKCKQLAANVRTAAQNLGVEIELEKVTDINAITGAGIMMTPALAVDGKVVSVGRVLSSDAAAQFLRPAGGCCGEKCASPKPSAPETEPSPCCCGERKVGKRLLTAVLLLFVVASVAFVIVREVKGKSAVPAPAAAVPVNRNVMTVYYFHGTQRCMTCNRIEQMARAAMETKFADALKTGRMIFRSVNVDDAANEHFIRDFQLAARTVVMEKNGKFEKFDAVWTLAGEPEKFAAYLQQGAEKMMDSGK